MRPWKAQALLAQPGGAGWMGLLLFALGSHTSSLGLDAFLLFLVFW